MEFDKQTILEEIQKRGGDHEKAADELPDKVDHERHADLLKVRRRAGRHGEVGGWPARLLTPLARSP